MAHGNAREGKWRGIWRMEWVASTLHTTSERGVSSITTADAYTSAASSRLNWRPRRFKWTRPCRRKTKSGFCACAITFQTHNTTHSIQRTIVYLCQYRLFYLHTFICVCDGPLPSPGESYRACVGVWACVRVIVFKCNNSPIHLQWLGWRGQIKK